jgi:hypothetical protein
MNMSEEKHVQQWTQKEVQAAIDKATENEPEGPNRDYWTTAVSRDEIKRKYGLKKFKPDPLTVTLVRECCGKEFVHVLTAREKAKSLRDRMCIDPQCRRRTTVMPFGKFAGIAVPLVYEQQPSYLAWFHETVQGCEEVKAVIRGLDGIETHLTAFRKRPQPPPKQLTPTQQQVEWLMGKFTTETIDAVCDELFGGEE